MKITHLAFVKYDGKNPTKLALLGRFAISTLCFLLSCGICLLANLIAVLNNEFGRSFYDVFSGLKMVNQYDL